MNYVFFDVECANCLHGEGKICSLGYVKTDEQFHVLKKKDILIDPAAKFLLGNAKNGNGIQLAYPLFRFKWAHTFPSYYAEISKLLTDPDNLVFGFAVFQDVSYVSYTCSRYNLSQLNYSYFDIQKLEQVMNQERNPTSLDKLIVKYNLQPSTYHKSDDDALMTMEVFKAILTEHQLDVQTVMKLYPGCSGNSLKLMSQVAEHKKAKEKQLQNRKRRAEFFASLSQYKPEVACYDPFVWKKKVFFDHSVFDSGMSYLEHHGKDLVHKGAVILSTPVDADYIISIGRNSKVMDVAKPNCQYMDMETFKSMLK